MSTRDAGLAALVVCLAAFIGCATEDERPPVPTHVVSEGTLSRTIRAEGNLQAATATKISPPPIPGVFEPMKLAWLAEDGSVVKKGDVVFRFDPTGLERKLADGKADHDSASAQLGRERIAGKSAATKRDADANLAKLALEKTRRFREKDPEIYSRNQIIEAEVDEGLSVARRKHAEAAKKIERGISRSKAQLAAVAKRVAADEIKRASAGLAALEVRAPHDGLLVLSRNWRGELPRVGAAVWPGMTLGEIPALDVMEAEIFILEVDGGSLTAGTEVDIKVESVPDQRFKGTIKRVDDIAKERVRGVPVRYFAATVELEKTVPSIMKPGQRVQATLRLADESGIVIPRHAVFVIDGDEVVFVSRDGEFEAQAVELGVATSAKVLVEKGLSKGDVIALSDPRDSAGGGSGNGTAGSSSRGGSAAKDGRK